MKASAIFAFLQVGTAVFAFAPVLWERPSKLSQVERLGAGSGSDGAGGGVPKLRMIQIL